MKFSLFEMALGLALLTGQTDAFWRMECRGRSGLARIDPLVNPGAMSAHAHTIAGGSGKFMSIFNHNLLGAAVSNPTASTLPTQRRAETRAGRLAAHQETTTITASIVDS